MTDTQDTVVAVQPQPSSTPFPISQAIEEHLPLAQKVARMAYHRYGRKFEHDDLIGYAHLGLVKAAHQYAGLKYDIRQAIDFSLFAEKRIWRHIEWGRDQMAHVRRTQYRRIKRGQAAPLRWVRDGDDFCLADVLADDGDPADLAHLDAEQLMCWIRDQQPRSAEIVALRHDEELTWEEIAQRLGGTPNAASGLYRRAVNLLKWRFNESAYIRDDRTARRHRAERGAS